MLLELRVENLLLIERAELRLGPGLNVLTGETGAGKTVLAHALDLLLGGKPRPGIVRPGASEAYVEGVFELPAALRAALGERLPEDADELVLARRVSGEGRTRAYLGGRSATAGDLRELGGALLSFYGQHEHRRLTLASAQLEILDGFCGPEQSSRRAAFAAAYARERALRDALEELRERAGARDRELDLLELELEEIERAGPDEAEEESLRGERERLRHLEALQSRGARAARRRAGRGDDGRVVGRRSTALGSGRAGVDPALDALADRASALVRRGRRPRRASCAATASRSRRRLAASRRSRSASRCSTGSKRKHGGTIAAVLAHAEECRRRRDELAGAEEALRGGRGGARGGARGAGDPGRGAARGAGRGGRVAGGRGAWRGSTGWRWRARRSRPASRRARATARAAATTSSS